MEWDRKRCWGQIGLESRLQDGRGRKYQNDDLAPQDPGQWARYHHVIRYDSAMIKHFFQQSKSQF